MRTDLFRRDSRECGSATDRFGQRTPPSARLRAAIWAAALAALLVLPGTAIAAPVKIVALGDSLTAGLGLKESEAFPAQLEAALKKRGKDVVITNAGVSGDTASAGLMRLDWSVPDGTDAVILALGANDMLRGIDPAQTRKALDEAIRKLKSRNIEVLVAGMRAAPNMGAEYSEKFDRIYPELAEQHGVLLHKFFLDGVAGERDLNLPDGMHPTARGVSILVERILPSVESLIERVNKRRG